MKKLSWICSFIVVSALSFAACGKFPVGGTATFNESLTPNPFMPMNSACTTTQVSMTFYNSNGHISGQEVGPCFSEQLSGTDAGNGQITGVTLTMYPSAQMNPYQNSYPNQTPPTCSYAGTLNFANNMISGFLALQTPAPQPSALPGGSYCSPTVNLQGGLTQ